MNDLVQMNLSQEELSQKLLEETDISSIKNIIELFNLNIKKKDVIRTSKLNELQDKVYDQMDKRLTQKADEFSNKDLIEYFKTIQDSINKADMSLNSVDVPAIQIIHNHNQLNITENNTLDSDSRKRVSEAVQKILRAIKEKEIQEARETIDNEYVQLTLDLGEENVNEFNEIGE